MFVVGNPAQGGGCGNGIASKADPGGQTATVLFVQHGSGHECRGGMARWKGIVAGLVRSFARDGVFQTIDHEGIQGDGKSKFFPSPLIQFLINADKKDYIILIHRFKRIISSFYRI